MIICLCICILQCAWLNDYSFSKAHKAICIWVVVKAKVYELYMCCVGWTCLCTIISVSIEGLRHYAIDSIYWRQSPPTHKQFSTCLHTDLQWVPSDRAGEAERVTFSQDARRRNNSHCGCNCEETKREGGGSINEDRCVREGKIEKKPQSWRTETNQKWKKRQWENKREEWGESVKVAGGRGLQHVFPRQPAHNPMVETPVIITAPAAACTALTSVTERWEAKSTLTVGHRYQWAGGATSTQADDTVENESLWSISKH